MNAKTQAKLRLLETTYEVGNKTWGVCIAGGGDILAQLIENKADAILFAAAPETAAERDRLKEINAELLGACKIVADEMQVVISHNDPVPEKWFERRLRILRAAIEKAEARV